MKSNFKISNIRETIEGTNHRTSEDFHQIYQRAIDFGAHPNEKSIASVSQIFECEENKQIQKMLILSNGPEQELALKATSQAGICALEILQSIFDSRFRILGVHEKLFDLRRDPLLWP